VLAPDLRVDRFVACDPVARHRDRSVSAVCRVRDRNAPLGPEVDLAAWMLVHGWAVARPEGPFEYHVLERLARHHGRGIWGFPAAGIGVR
jgi:endonuclease YncB( thermonuclease family)